MSSAGDTHIKSTRGPSRESMDERVGSVERDVFHLFNEFHEFRSGEFNNFRQEVRDQFGSLRHIIEGNRQPLTAYAGLVAVLFSFGAAALYPLMKDQDRQRARTDELRMMVIDHVRDGHPGKTDQKIELLRDVTNSKFLHEEKMRDIIWKYQDKTNDRNEVNKLERELGEIRVILEQFLMNESGRLPIRPAPVDN